MSAYINTYYNQKSVKKAVEDGNHRQCIGGLWDELGLLQLNYLRVHGLQTDDFIVDVGCGCLRAGVHFVDYMQAERYFGIDISKDLLDVGFKKELMPLGLDKKLPRSHLYCTDAFDVKQFNKSFNFAIAQSVFSHLPLNHLLMCLQKLSEVMPAGGRFFTTMFLARTRQEWLEPLLHDPGGIVSHPLKDPFHYLFQDIELVVDKEQWGLTLMDDWQHPRDQQMLVFERR